MRNSVFWLFIIQFLIVAYICIKNILQKKRKVAYGFINVSMKPLIHEIKRKNVTRKGKRKNSFAIPILGFIIWTCLNKR